MQTGEAAGDKKQEVMLNRLRLIKNVKRPSVSNGVIFAALANQDWFVRRTSTRMSTRTTRGYPSLGSSRPGGKWISTAALSTHSSIYWD